MRFSADEKNVKVTGRTLFIDETRYLGFSGSSISFVFEGKYAAACIWSTPEDFGEELKARLAVFIDDGEEPVKRICLDQKEALYTLYEGTEKRRVTVTVMKYSEAPFARCGIRYIETDSEELCTPPAPRKRKMEIIGDSITCGYGVEAAGELIPFHTETENPTKSYSLLTAKALNADVNLVSWSGNGIISGYVEEDAVKPSDVWLMPEVYRYTDIAASEKLYGWIESKWEKWDFGRFIPDIILVNLGTNDCSWCKDIRERKEDFRDGYVEFLTFIREHNPGAQILCMLGTMDQRLLAEVEEAVEIMNREREDKAVHFLALPAQDPNDGYGSDWHPCMLTQQKTAELVTAKVRAIMNWMD